MINEKRIEIKTWNKLWSRPEKQQGIVLASSLSIHPRNWGKAKPKGREA